MSVDLEAIRKRWTRIPSGVAAWMVEVAQADVLTLLSEVTRLTEALEEKQERLLVALHDLAVANDSVIHFSVQLAAAQQRDNESLTTKAPMTVHDIETAAWAALSRMAEIHLGDRLAIQKGLGLIQTREFLLNDFRARLEEAVRLLREDGTYSEVTEFLRKYNP